MKKAMAVAASLALAATAALAGGNPANKIAIHIKAHPTVCGQSYPGFSSCTDISFAWSGTGDLDVMPVFFDLTGYTATEFGLAWPAGWGSMTWVRCLGDHATGTIVDSGDGTVVTWTDCRETWSVAPGFGWLVATGAGTVCPVANGASGEYGVIDCAPSPGPFYDHPLVVSCAGVGGMIGDDPCRWVEDAPSTWGAVKAIFR